jgi:hypothetical protein
VVIGGCKGVASKSSGAGGWPRVFPGEPGPVLYPRGPRLSRFAAAIETDQAAPAGILAIRLNDRGFEMSAYEWKP